jgi:STE24 endopeptidase
MTLLQILLLLLLGTKYLFERILSLLNARTIRSKLKEFPKEVRAYMDIEDWEKCSEYTLSKSRFAMVEEFYSLSLSFFILFFGLPWTFRVWPVDRFTPVWETSFLVTSLVIVIQLSGLVFDWFRQFHLEQKFGFNNQTHRLWFFDKVKETLLSFVFFFLMIGLLVLLYRECSILSPNYWWFWSFGAVFFLQLVLMVLWPRFILPLFNTLSPLEDVGLKSKLHRLAEKTGFKAKEIQVIDGSKRSGHSNAFFTGFGRFRKIVLYDTLLEQMTENEIEAVVAHEIGHYRLGHIPKRLAMSLVLGWLFFYILHLLLSTDWLIGQLELSDQLSGAFVPVFLFALFFGGCFSYWLNPVSNLLSRKHEYEADRFASEATGGSQALKSALRKLCVKNLSYPLPHPWLSYFHHSHPSLPEREFSLSQDAEQKIS